MTPTDQMSSDRVWRINPEHVLDLREPRLIGIVNATPDSFSDGGMFKSTDALIGHALRLVEEGVSVIDVGGESTRPGAVRIDAQLQIERTVPFIEQFRQCCNLPLSIDTTRADVARAALDAGASIINDVSAGREDDLIFPLAAERGCGLILMHRRLPPDRDSYSHDYAEEPHYDDVVTDVRRFLQQRADAARAAGVSPHAIVIDPGLGFGKSVSQNYQLIRRTDELLDLGYPLLSGASRKSFIGAVTGAELPRDRAIASAALTVLHYLAGVRLFRVHDPAAHRQALAVTQAVQRASKSPRSPRHPVG